MNPEPGEIVGRNLQPQALQDEAVDAGLVGLDHDGAGAAENPQDLEAQRRHAHVLGIHDHRHAAHDTVALGHDGEQAASGGGVFQHLHIAQQPAELEDEGIRVLAEHGETGDRQILVEVGVDVMAAGFAEHHARALDGVGEDAVVARQRAQFLPRRLVEPAEILGGVVRIEPVGLGEHHVEGDHDRAHPGQGVDDVGDAGARPGPLPEPGIGEALLVDIDDGDRPCLLHPGIEQLEGVEGADTQLFDRQRGS